MRFAPHLPWRDEPLSKRLSAAPRSARIQGDVLVDNDATAALWAEARFGAAPPVRDALMITLGTGIGGGLLVHGALHRGANGMAGEFGHMQVVPDGRQCQCGRRGCWEQYCSGRALARAAAEAGSDLSGPALTTAAYEGDPVATGGVRPGGVLARASAWPTWWRRSTRRSSWWVAACPRPVSCCSSPPGSRWRESLVGAGLPGPAQLVGAELGRSPGWSVSPTSPADGAAESVRRVGQVGASSVASWARKSPTSVTSAAGTIPVHVLVRLQHRAVVVVVAGPGPHRGDQVDEPADEPDHEHQTQPGRQVEAGHQAHQHERRHPEQARARPAAGAGPAAAAAAAAAGRSGPPARAARPRRVVAGARREATAARPAPGRRSSTSGRSP